jgi:hypothetical protein
MATASGFQAISTGQQVDHTTTPSLAQADPTQSSATTAPSQNASSATLQETDPGATSPVPQDSVTSSPATHQGPIKWREWRLSKWFLKYWHVIFINVVLVTIYFVIGYLKNPDREWASIENEYKFCEAHPVRLITRFKETELTSLLLFRNTTECKENESLVWKKYGLAPPLMKRAVHETDKQNSHWTLLVYPVLVLLHWVGYSTPDPNSTRLPLAQQTSIGLTRFEKYKVVSISLLLLPYGLWTVKWTVRLFLRCNWSFSFLVVLEYAFCVNIIFKFVIYLYEMRKEQKECIRMWVLVLSRTI